MVGVHTEEALAPFRRKCHDSVAKFWPKILQRVLNSCTSLSHIYLGARAPNSILCYICIIRPLAVAFFGCMPSP